MVNFKENEQLNTLNHSCAHVMAQAIKHLYPNAKFWVGPVVASFAVKFPKRKLWKCSKMILTNWT